MIYDSWLYYFNLIKIWKQSFGFVIQPIRIYDIDSILEKCYSLNSSLDPRERRGAKNGLYRLFFLRPIRHSYNPYFDSNVGSFSNKFRSLARSWTFAKNRKNSSIYCCSHHPSFLIFTLSGLNIPESFHLLFNYKSIKATGFKILLNDFSFWKLTF